MKRSHSNRSYLDVNINKQHILSVPLEDGEDSAMTPQKRPTYSQPSIMPRKQWVVVKTERAEDDDLIVVSGEEGGDDEEEEDEREMELVEQERERGNFNISNIRSLSGELGGRADSDMDSQVSRRLSRGSFCSGMKQS